MPVMDGLSMIHEIKQDTTLNNIPVMILSAKASVEDQQRGFDEGIVAYITKPFSTPYLLGRIEAILTQRRNIQMDVIRKLKETGDKDAIAALRILPTAAPLPALNQAETSAENEAVDPSSELAFMAAQIQDRTMMRVFWFVVAKCIGFLHGVSLRVNADNRFGVALTIAHRAKQRTAIHRDETMRLPIANC